MLSFAAILSKTGIITVLTLRDFPMYKPLSIISGACLLGTGFVMYNDVKNVRSSEIAQKVAAEANLVSAGKKLKDFNEARTKADEALVAAKDDLAKKTGERESTTAARDAKIKELEDITKVKEAAEKDLADTEAKLKDVGGLDVIVAEVKKLEGESAELGAKIAGLKDSTTAAIASKATTDKMILGLRKLDLWQKTGTMDPGFTTRVASVNPDYGFLELPVGNNSNVVNSAKFDVQRGGSVLCTAIVTHIEPGRAIAEVVPGTLAAGQMVLPGDRLVVNTDSKPKADAPAAPAAKKPAADAAPAADPADPFATPGAPAAKPDAPAAAPDATMPAAEKP